MSSHFVRSHSFCADAKILKPARELQDFDGKLSDGKVVFLKFVQK